MHSQLPFYGVVRVKGADRQSFLNGQLSNDVAHLAQGQACYASYNNPKGRVIATVLVCHLGDELWLLLAHDLVEKVVNRLRMFVLRAQVVFEILPDWGVAGALADGAEVRYPVNPCLSFPVSDGGTQLPHGGIMTIGALTDLPEYDVGAELMWRKHEILSGYPHIDASTTETCVAQMLNLQGIGAVHFRKGCYPGQEVIARAQYRGQVKRGLIVVQCSPNNVAGAKVVDGLGQEVGIVINVAEDVALLVVKHSAVCGELLDEQGSVFVLKHAFFDRGDVSS